MCFLIVQYGICKTTLPDILRFVSMRFLIFEKGIRKKTVPAILTFVSMLIFNIQKRE